MECDTDLPPNLLSTVMHGSGGLVRLVIESCAVTSPTDELSALRTFLVADVLTRIVELAGAQVSSLALLASRSVDLQSAWRAWNIHPPETIVVKGTDTLVSSPSVWVRPTRQDPALREAKSSDSSAVPTLLVERVSAADAPAWTPETALPCRLALLRVGREDRCQVGANDVRQAAALLSRWRRAVATWSQAPSRPMPGALHQLLVHETIEGLRYQPALDLLHSVERDPHLPAGAKFETFLYVDRILGLDLASEMAGDGDPGNSSLPAA